MDVEKLDVARFPLFEKATEYRMILQPGEMIFIPRGWWHHVRSLDKSISVLRASEADPARRRHLPRTVHLPHRAQRQTYAPQRGELNEALPD
jgi:hypothetical protein